MKFKLRRYLHANGTGDLHQCRSSEIGICTIVEQHSDMYAEAARPKDGWALELSHSFVWSPALGLPRCSSLRLEAVALGNVLSA
jgi:hypothetical protein